GIHVFAALLLTKTWMAGTIGERSDAVLRTAMASEATPFFERLWRAKRRRSSNGYGERSDAVLRTAMRGHDDSEPGGSDASRQDRRSARRGRGVGQRHRGADAAPARHPLCE